MAVTAGPRKLSRSNLALVGALVALAALAWVLTARRMSGMDAGPGTDLGTLGFYVSVWVVMMAAMMAPAISPMVTTYAAIQRGRRERYGTKATGVPLFVGGYLITWTAFGLLAYGLFVGVRALQIGALRWHEGGRYVAAGVLLAAAAYQLTPAKDACLRRCRGPLSFVLEHWRDGPVGAVRMGIVHGAWCVGCCWGLMAGLFALGAMSIPWMIVIAAVITAEKLLPGPDLTTRTTAALLAALAIGVAVWPSHVPGLTVPGSSAARGAEMSMGMQMQR